MKNINLTNLLTHTIGCVCLHAFFLVLVGILKKKKKKKKNRVYNAPVNSVCSYSKVDTGGFILLVNDEFFLADNIFQYDTVEISSRIFSVFKFVEGLKNETHALLENLQHQKNHRFYGLLYYFL
jgi:hypothetical protein